MNVSNTTSGSDPASKEARELITFHERRCEPWSPAAPEPDAVLDIEDVTVLTAKQRGLLTQLRRGGDIPLDVLHYLAMVGRVSVPWLLIGIALVALDHPVWASLSFVVTTVTLILGASRAKVAYRSRQADALEFLLSRPGVRKTVTVSCAADHRAYALAMTARAERQSITQVQGWSESGLDVHHARLDVDLEVERIFKRAALIAEKRKELGTDSATLHHPDAEPLRKIHRVLDQSLESLRRRVVALVRYRLTLEDYDAQRRVLHAIGRAQRVDLSDLALDVADDHVAVALVHELNQEIEDARMAATAAIESLAKQTEAFSRV